MEKIWDNQRKKAVTLTPEEQVRSWFVDYLKTCLNVPEGLVGTEVSLKAGDKPYRADIVVYSRNLKPVALVECKRPDVEISAETLLQAARYHSILNVKFIFLTNGRTTFVAENKDGSFGFLSKAPTYNEMTGR